jgi:hypothetical protein
VDRSGPENDQPFVIGPAGVRRVAHVSHHQIGFILTPKRTMGCSISRSLFARSGGKKGDGKKGDRRNNPPDTWLQLERWRSHWNPTEWRRYLTESEAAGDLAAIRRCTHTVRPLGSPEFVDSLERELQRPLKPRKRGRSPSPPVAQPQEALALTR